MKSMINIILSLILIIKVSSVCKSQYAFDRDYCIENNLPTGNKIKGACCYLSYTKDGSQNEECLYLKDPKKAKVAVKYYEDKLSYTGVSIDCNSNYLVYIFNLLILLLLIL